MTPKETTPAVKRRFRVKMFGVGGAGCNAVNHIARTPVDGVEFFALNPDAAALAQLSVPNKVILGEKLTGLPAYR